MTQKARLFFDPPLIQGILIKRYKRFMADVLLPNGDTITVHCPNSGSMLGLVDPGNPVALSLSPNPNRRLPMTLEMIQVQKTWVGVNTQNPNKLVMKAWESRQIPLFEGYDQAFSEVAYDQGSRIDLLLKSPALPDMYVEVKNVTLKQGDSACFPDSVTARGTKHLKALINMMDMGHKACLFYVIQRDDCNRFEIAENIDPVYGDAFRQAVQKGLHVLCYACSISPEYIMLSRIVG